MHVNSLFILNLYVQLILLMNKPDVHQFGTDTTSESNEQSSYYQTIYTKGAKLLNYLTEYWEVLGIILKEIKTDHMILKESRVKELQQLSIELEEKLLSFQSQITSLNQSYITQSSEIINLTNDNSE